MIPVEIEVGVDEDARTISDDLTWGKVLDLADVAGRVGDEGGDAEDEGLPRHDDRAGTDLSTDPYSHRAATIP